MWSTYDTFILITGIIIAAIALLPVSGIPAKTRFLAALGGAGVILLALFLGSLSSFRYPSFVFVAPFVALLGLGVVIADARKRTRDDAESLQFHESAQSSATPPPPEPSPAVAALEAPIPASDAATPAAPRNAPAPPPPTPPSMSASPAPPPEPESEPVSLPKASDPREDAWNAVADPVTSTDELVAILTEYPEFGPAALDHPNVYPELREWIQVHTLS